jgi:hypothetical protein
MAVNKLVRGGTEISLMAGTDGIRLADEGYIPTIVQRNEDGTWPQSVQDVLNLYIEGTDQDDLIGNIKALTRILNDAADWSAESVDGTQTWWHRQLENETYEHRALVRRGFTELNANPYSQPFTLGKFAKVYTLGIERGSFWELESRFTLASDRLETTGDVFDYTPAPLLGVVGDVPARTHVEFYGDAGSTALSEFWVGIRTDRFGDRTKFQPVWQCEDAGSLGADTSDTGTELTCTFAGTTTMAERFAFKLSDVISTAGDEDEHRGRFLVLLRAQVTGTLVARLQMKSGYRDTSVWRYHDYTTVDNTSYFFYPLGEIQIPPKTRHITYAESTWKDEEYFGLAIDAEVASGTGSILFDRIVVIPQSEGWCHVKDGYAYWGASQWITYLLRTPEDELTVRLSGAQTTAHTPYFDDGKLYLPGRYSKGYAIYAAQGSTASVAGEYGRVTFQGYSRYETLAGDGT